MNGASTVRMRRNTAYLGSECCAAKSDNHEQRTAVARPNGYAHEQERDSHARSKRRSDSADRQQTGTLETQAKGDATGETEQRYRPEAKQEATRTANSTRITVPCNG
jgi:hypothetical protein